MTQSRAGFRLPDTHQVTVADMAEVRQQGYDDGFEEGREAGYTAGAEEGKAAMQAEIELELVKIRQLVQAMQHPFQDFRDEIVLELKALTKDICESFLRHQLAQDQQTLGFLVEESVKQLLPTDHQIVVHVNDHNAGVVEQALAGHLEEKGWRIQKNAKLSNGNVFLESGHSRVKIDMQALLTSYLTQMAEKPPEDTKS